MMVLNTVHLFWKLQVNESSLIILEPFPCVLLPANIFLHQVVFKQRAFSAET